MAPYIVLDNELPIISKFHHYEKDSLRIDCSLHQVFFVYELLIGGGFAAALFATVAVLHNSEIVFFQCSCRLAGNTEFSLELG